MTKMTVMPIYGKNLTKNHWTGETWYVASRTMAHHSLYKSLPLVDHELFYGKIKIWSHRLFNGGKSENIVFSRKLCSL